jgi:hypothetical protein
MICADGVQQSVFEETASLNRLRMDYRDKTVRTTKIGLPGVELTPLNRKGAILSKNGLTIPKEQSLGHHSEILAITNNCQCANDLPNTACLTNTAGSLCVHNDTEQLYAAVPAAGSPSSAVQCAAGMQGD